MNRCGKALVFCAAATLIPLIAGALYLKRQADSSPIQTEPVVPPGRLTGVMNSYSGGMSYRNDFFIWLSPNAIVEAFYYPEEPPKGVEWHERFVKEDVPITAQQWADIERMVIELYPLMKPEPERKSGLWSVLGHWLGAVDGNDSSSLTLIWDTGEGEQKVRYAFPDDDRISILITLLKELADPIGREIPAVSRQS